MKMFVLDGEACADVLANGPEALVKYDADGDGEAQAKAKALREPKTIAQTAAMFGIGFKERDLRQA